MRGSTRRSSCRSPTSTVACRALCARESITSSPISAKSSASLTTPRSCGRPPGYAASDVSSCRCSGLRRCAKALDFSPTSAPTTPSISSIFTAALPAGHSHRSMPSTSARIPTFVITRRARRSSTTRCAFCTYVRHSSRTMRCACGTAPAIAMRKHPLGSEAELQRMGSTHLWHLAAVILATAALVGFAGWTTIALWFQAPGGPLLRGVFMATWLAFSLAALVALHRGYGLLALLAFALATGGVLLWWHSLKPSNDRIWADDVARTTSGEVHGDRATLSNVRNFDWRSETDYTQRWETRSYD